MSSVVVPTSDTGKEPGKEPGKEDTGKQYRSQCTGVALETVKQHRKPQDITLFASCFCPFVQRVWVALQFLAIPYKVRVRTFLLGSRSVRMTQLIPCVVL